LPLQRLQTLRYTLQRCLDQNEPLTQKETITAALFIAPEGIVILKAIFCLLPPRRVFLFREDPVNLIIRRLTGLFLSANGPSKRKSTSENLHQSAPIRIPSSSLRNQNIWVLGAA
jgi:hypothetical protein